ncbi:MAG: pre-peptidase C-terminal domain-containing protein [Verrucomicrobia bacterium]|nr:pre-peptidase C-terminal domain-containing protein [Verrucomicrobiota bacterium]
MKAHKKLVLGFTAVGALALAFFWLRSRVEPAAPAAHVATQPARALPPADLAAAHAGRDATSAAAPAASPAATPDAKSAELFALIPAGAFRDTLLRLDEPVRRRTLAKLAKLEVPSEDFTSLRATPDGALYYVCSLPASLMKTPAIGAASKGTSSSGTTTTTTQAAAVSTSVAISAPPVRHSRPGATNVLYLDFNGCTVTNTRWNSTYGAATYTALPYDTDGDRTTFSADEQAAIIQIWERVSEDYAAFNVDVTTEQPAVFTNTTGRAVITASTDANGIAMPDGSSGGVAFIDVFGDFDYASSSSPVFIYYTNFSGNTANLADAVAHELGHNLGLSHDGQTNGTEYYGGHGTGETSWGPIMGAPYGRNVTQWSKGEYYLANNTQDDIAIIAAHIGYRPDEAGGTIATAAAASVSGTALSAAGVFNTSADLDIYAFNTAAGTVSLTVSPYRAATGTYGGDTDTKIELLTAAGKVVATADPATTTGASLSYTATAGTYFVRLTPSSTGTPLATTPTGYTSYGSIGQYTLTGTVVPAIPAITSATTATTGGGQPFTYAIVATNSPTSYTASGLPAGLSLDPVSGIISGSAGVTGTFAIALTATNALGTGNATLTLTVVAAPPAITAQTGGLLVAAPGDSLVLSVTAATIDNTLAYQWKFNGVAIKGATASTLPLSTVTAASAGFYQVAVTNTTGTTLGAINFVRIAPATTQVVGWGDNTGGQTNVPATLTDAIALGAGFSHALALHRDGSVTGWGDNSIGQLAFPAGLGAAVAVDGGYYHSLALKADGTVAAWGYNGSGQTAVPAGLANVVAIAAGYYHSLAVKADGTVAAWGDNSYGQSTVPAGLANVIAVAGGSYHSVALKADGTVVAWGANYSGQATVPAGLTGVVAIAAGAEQSLALKADGTVVAWGYTANAVVPAGSGALKALAAGSYHALGLKSDGTVAAWGDNSYGQTVIPAGLTNVIALDARGGFSLALSTATTGAKSTAVAPAFTAQPVNVTVTAGTAASFTAAASGTPVPSLQWQSSADAGVTWANLSNGTTYSGATTGTLTVAAPTVALSGTQFRCLASNSAQANVASAAATLTVNALNTAPTITTLAAQTLKEDTASAALAFTVGDAQTAAASLTVTAASSNATLFPAAGIVLGGSGSARTVTLTPAANQAGTATITLTVSDGTLTTSTSFGVTVTAVNDAPTISAIANQTILTNGTTAALAFTVADTETAATALTVTKASSNTTLVPVANIVLGGSGSARTVTVTPASGKSGTATITLTVSDGSLTASSAFVVTVIATNTAPTITSIASQTINQDTSTAALAFTIGDAQTAVANLAVTATSSNATLLPASGIILAGTTASRTVKLTPAARQSTTASRTVKLTPAARQSGTATVTLTVSDGSLTASTSFTLTVKAVNTAPTISAIAAQTVTVGTVAGPLAFTVGDAETAATGLTVTAASSNLTLVPVANIALSGADTARTVTVTPAAGQTGSATITLTVSDGALKTATAFVLTVNAANTAPTISAIPNQTVLVSTSSNTLAFTIGDAETAATSLTLTATSSNTTLVAANKITLGGSGAARTVTVTPTVKVTGTSTITLTVSDGTLKTSSSFVVTVVASNDAFANAITLTGAKVSTKGSNTGATKESGEPNHAGVVGGKSVWWRWTAPASGPVSVNTVGSTFDTLLAVYTGTAVNALSVVASDDNVGGNKTSALTFTAVAGTTYSIAVDGAAGATGTIYLSLTQGTATTAAAATDAGTDLSITLPAGASVILTSPADQVVQPGDTVVFAVTTSDAASAHYQWYCNDDAIRGATGPTLTLRNVQADDAASYWVAVVNANGAASSEPADLTVVTATASSTTNKTGAVITTTISVAGQATGLDLQLALPAGWSYAGGKTTVSADTAPSAGDTDQLEWTWGAAPAKVTLTCTLTRAAGSDPLPDDLSQLLFINEPNGARELLLPVKN